MRHYIITCLFTAMSICCLAQPTFTEKTMQDIKERILADYPQYLKEDLASDFTFIIGDGRAVSATVLQGLTEAKILDWSISELKLKQFGHLVLATGVNKHSMVFSKGGIPKLYNVGFTYTYEYKNNKWFWIHAQHTAIQSPVSEDEMAIKKILDEQVAAVYAGDVAAIQKFYKDDPKAFHIVNGTAGEFMWRDNESIKSSQQKAKPRDGTPVRSNYNIKIVGNMATAHYDQNNTSNDGKVRTEHNLHILEKVNNEWKIFGTSIHPNNLANEEKPEEIVKQWVADYNKDNKAFFEKTCTEDFIASNSGINGGKFFGKEFTKNRKEGMTSDAEITDTKSFQSGDLAVVMGIMTWHHKQADGTDKPDKMVTTFVMQKKNGQWWSAGQHLSPLKE